MKRTAVVLLVLLMVVVACGGSSTTLVLVDAAGAEALIETESELVVLDIRTPEEVAEGTLPGAIDLNFYDASFSDDLAQLDRSKPYLVYCRSGNRSEVAVQTMKDLGFAEVYELDGGILSWTGSG